MARDSLFGEQVIWSGRPERLTAPFASKVAAIVAGTVSVVALCYAILVACSLHASPTSLLFFGGWCATLALGAIQLPKWWLSLVEYKITSKHVIWKRGRIRRTIDRAAISYALIRWDKHDPTCGDLILVRAVPTGALRRTLTIQLSGVKSPDRLWAQIRSLSPSASLGDGSRPIAQRLDEGERVLWSAMPVASAWTVRRVMTAIVSAIVGVACVQMIHSGIPSIIRVARWLNPQETALLAAAMGLVMLLLLALTLGIGYTAILRPVLIAKQTRYFVTNTRVLIRRGLEELHVDRSHITYVIDAPTRGLHDVFLVLDGPQARALAMSGAFGDDDRDILRPVFASIADADAVNELLAENSESGAFRKAA